MEVVCKCPRKVARQQLKLKTKLLELRLQYNFSYYNKTIKMTLNLGNTAKKLSFSNSQENLF